MDMIRGLDHVAIIVSSIESLKFYEKLGFRETKRIERSHDIVVFMECESVVLEIFVDPNHPKRLSYPEAFGLRHMAFRVNNLDDVVKEIECEEIRTDWFGRRFAFAKDPDGLPIELKEEEPIEVK